MRNSIAVLISCLSLIASLTSLYFSSLRQEDYLKVSIAGVPLATFDPDKKRFLIDDTEKMLFVNSGNRPVAVTGAAMYITQGASSKLSDDYTPDSCLDYAVPTYYYKLDTNVIKANDIQTITARPDLDHPGPETEGGKVVAHVNERLEGFVRYLNFCIGIFVATLDKDYIPNNRFAVYTEVFNAGDGKEREFSSHSVGFHTLVQHGNGLMRLPRVDK